MFSLLKISFLPACIPQADRNNMSKISFQIEIAPPINGQAPIAWGPGLTLRPKQLFEMNHSGFT